MGWFYSWNKTKAQLLEELRESDRFTKPWVILHSSVVGNNHWYLLHNPETKQVNIGLDMLSAGGKDEGWGYKPLTENCGPCEVNCPLTFLARASEPTGYAIEWREKVRAHHAKRKEKKGLCTGSVVKYGGHDYRLLHPAGPRKGWNVRRVLDDHPFRMNAQQLSRAEIVAAV
jgi:hypothetical protein